MTGFDNLEQVIGDPVFPAVDVRLKQGRHISVEDVEEYAFLDEAGVWLEDFYRRFECDLVRVDDGYFYLQSAGELLGRAHLSAGAMLVGQTLALLTLDPATTASSGRIPQAMILTTLAGIVGQEELLSRLSGRRRTQSASEEDVRRAVRKAVRELEALGFLDRLDDEVKTRSPIMRFAEPVRGAEPGRLAELIASGALVATDEEEDED